MVEEILFRHFQGLSANDIAEELFQTENHYWDGSPVHSPAYLEFVCLVNDVIAVNALDNMITISEERLSSR